MGDAGVVRFWFDDAGWGVVDSKRTPGGCWAHFSAVAVGGPRALVPGQAVELEWERAEQDGFTYRAVRVWPVGVAPADAGADVEVSGGSAAAAYTSTLKIVWDR